MIEKAPAHQRQHAAIVPLAFVLLLGLMLFTIHVYQAYTIPGMGAQSEIEANNALLTDAQEFNFAVQSHLTTNEVQPVALGEPVQYPLLSQATQPTYSVRMAETWEVEFDHYACLEGDCVENTTTSNVIFAGDYMYHQTPNIYGYEYGALYTAPFHATEGGEGVTRQTGQSIISGNTLQIIAFQGSYTNERAGTTHATITRVQTEPHEFTVTNTSDARINVTFPTELPEREWVEMLEPELVENGGHIEAMFYRPHQYLESEHETGNANQNQWRQCNKGKGQPFVRCVDDDDTNFVTLSLEPGVEYTVVIAELRLSE